MDENDRGFYESFKPSWSQSGTLVCVTSLQKDYNDQTQAFRASGVLGKKRITFASEGRSVELIPFDLPSNVSSTVFAVLVVSLITSLAVTQATRQTATEYKDYHSERHPLCKDFYLLQIQGFGRYDRWTRCSGNP